MLLLKRGAGTEKNYSEDSKHASDSSETSNEKKNVYFPDALF